MTEYQDIQATRHLNTNEFYFIGHPYEDGVEDETWSIYQTDGGEMFAVDNHSDKMSFEVYTTDEGEFLVY